MESGPALQVNGWPFNNHAKDLLSEEGSEMTDISCDQVGGSTGRSTSQDWPIFFWQLNAFSALRGKQGCRPYLNPLEQSLQPFSLLGGQEVTVLRGELEA